MTTGPRRHGFTLVELVVALAISGLVVTAAIAALGIVSGTADRRADVAGPALAEHASRAALEGWLRAASLDIAPFVGLDLRVGPLEIDELRMGITDGGFLHPGPAWLRLRVAPDGAGVQAELTSTRTPGAGTTVLLLAPDAQGLALRYRNRVGGRDIWVHSWESDVELPAAVEVRVLYGTGGGDPAGDAAPRSLHRLRHVLPVGWVGQ